MILVLGASSFIGRRMFTTLGSSGAIGTHKSTPVPGSVHFDATTMRLPDILPAVSDISHAVILYAETRIDICKADLNRSYQLNVDSTKRVIDDLSELGIKPVFFSSDWVFDGTKGNYLEKDTPAPTTTYGSQKLEVEQYLSNRCKDYLILRPARVFGTDPDDGSILSSWYQQIQGNETIRCARDQVFSPIHVDDVVKATKAVVDLDLGGVFHICNPEPCSRLEFLRTLLNCLGSKAHVIECSIRDFEFLEDRPLNLAMDPKKIIDATGLDFKTIESCCKEFSRNLTTNDSGSALKDYS